MELTENRILSFNEDHTEIFEKVDIEGHPLYLNGSFAGSSPFAGDIDLYTRISHEDLPEVVKLVRGFLNSSDMVITKVRIGEQRFYTKTAIRTALRKATALLAESPSTKSWLKVNMLLFTGESLEELSVVYDFSTKRLTDADIQESIKADIVNTLVVSLTDQILGSYILPALVPKLFLWLKDCFLLKTFELHLATYVNLFVFVSISKNLDSD